MYSFYFTSEAKFYEMLWVRVTRGNLLMHSKSINITTTLSRLGIARGSITSIIVSITHAHQLLFRIRIKFQREEPRIKNWLTDNEMVAIVIAIVKDYTLAQKYYTVNYLFGSQISVNLLLGQRLLLGQFLTVIRILERILWAYM